jgi:hypothetical protein
LCRAKDFGHKRDEIVQNLVKTKSLSQKYLSFELFQILEILDLTMSKDEKVNIAVTYLEAIFLVMCNPPMNEP